MSRALNMQKLTDELKSKFPGIIIYGIGDAAHRKRPSGHNEDDTPGSKPELEDADSKPEHRAIDVMVRGALFTKSDAEALVSHLLTTSRRRLYYIIWNGHIWSRSSGWQRRVYTGSDQHRDHVHISGWVDDDDNSSSWYSRPAPKPTEPERQIMEQTDKLIKDTGNANRTIGDFLADLQNLRNYLITPVTTPSITKPPANSPLGILVSLPDVLDHIAEVQQNLSAQVGDIQRQLAEAPWNAEQPPPSES